MGRGGFDPRLESLRGLAALTVCIHHGMSAFTGEPISFGLEWLLYAFNPAAAVMFFFVLSGYVLSQAIGRDKNLLRFYVRRLFRIIPPFIFSVFFAFACTTLIRLDPPPAGLSGFFQHVFWPAPTLDQLWDNLFLRSSWVNGPTWSIWPELVGSAVLPGFFFIHKFIGPRFKWVAFFSLSILLAFSELRLALWFYAGLFLPREIALAIGERKLIAVAAFILGLIVLQITGQYAVYYKATTIIPSAVGAALMIGAVASSREFLQWSEIAPLRFIGRLSFSLYLLHWPIFYLSALFVASHPLMPANNIFVMALSIIVAFTVSALTYRLVEIPTIQLESTSLGSFQQHQS